MAGSPLGFFSDVMVEDADGHRILLAPNEVVANFVGETYRFDEVRIESVELVRDGRSWLIRTPSVQIAFHTGRRGALGLLLRCIPRRLAVQRWWAQLLDPVARVVMPGVRTIGSAGADRREWYAALDLHPIVRVTVDWEGADLGDLKPVAPPVGFGFGSTPAQPSLVRVISTVQTPK